MRQQFTLLMSKLRTIDSSIRPFRSVENIAIAVQARKVEREVKKLRRLVSSKIKS
jgi:hypothetical protein